MPDRGGPEVSARSKFLYARYLSIVLPIAGVVALTLLPMPYVIFSPGPTVNVLGKVEGREVIAIKGREKFRDDGELRLTTVVVTSQSGKVNLFETMQAWLSDDQAVYPRDVVYKEDDTPESVRQESAAQMTSSQDAAVAAALTQLKIPFSPVVKVLSVVPDGASDGKLEKGDIVVSANGKPAPDAVALTDAIKEVKIGAPVKFVVRRDGKELPVTVKTVASETKPTRPVVQVVVGRGYEFPFEVDLSVGDAIGGPSGGLTFALGIYDLLTPGSLTGGKDIAGTGEINAEGQVGGIGGIQQKIAASQEAGAKLFLVPPSNCTEAAAANYDPKKMRLVKAETLGDVIESLETWTKDPAAKLPTCSPK